MSATRKSHDRHVSRPAPRSRACVAASGASAARLRRLAHGCVARGARRRRAGGGAEPAPVRPQRRGAARRSTASPTREPVAADAALRARARAAWPRLDALIDAIVPLALEAPISGEHRARAPAAHAPRRQQAFPASRG